jgi:hypothetical protein
MSRQFRNICCENEATACNLTRAQFNFWTKCGLGAGIVGTSGFDPNRTLRAPRRELWYPPSNAMGRFKRRCTYRLRSEAREIICKQLVLRKCGLLLKRFQDVGPNRPA